MNYVNKSNFDYVSDRQSMPHTTFGNLPLALVSRADVLGDLIARPSTEPFVYVVTPNIDHIVRAEREPTNLPAIYWNAWISLCDSRPLARLCRMLGVAIDAIPGSDLTRHLFEDVIRPDDDLVIIGGTEHEADELARKYKLLRIQQYIPPFGFVKDPAEVTKCVDFALANPARFVLIAVGSPQQEIVASAIRRTGQCSGVGLCIGASLSFLAGTVPRAPRWMQRLGIEWLHRLIKEPRRLARRYLVDDMKILPIFFRHVTSARSLPRPLGGIEWATGFSIPVLEHAPHANPE